MLGSCLCLLVECLTGCFESCACGLVSGLCCNESFCFSLRTDTFRWADRRRGGWFCGSGVARAVSGWGGGLRLIWRGSRGGVMRATEPRVQALAPQLDTQPASVSPKLARPKNLIVFNSCIPAKHDCAQTSDLPARRNTDPIPIGPPSWPVSGRVSASIKCHAPERARAQFRASPARTSSTASRARLPSPPALRSPHLRWPTCPPLPPPPATPRPSPSRNPRRTPRRRRPSLPTA